MISGAAADTGRRRAATSEERARGKWQCHPWQPCRSRTHGRGRAWRQRPPAPRGVLLREGPRDPAVVRRGGSHPRGVGLPALRLAGRPRPQRPARAAARPSRTRPTWPTCASGAPRSTARRSSPRPSPSSAATSLSRSARLRDWRAGAAAAAAPTRPPRPAGPASAATPRAPAAGTCTGPAPGQRQVQRPRLGLAGGDQPHLRSRPDGRERQADPQRRRLGGATHADDRPHLLVRRRLTGEQRGDVAVRTHAQHQDVEPGHPAVVARPGGRGQGRGVALGGRLGVVAVRAVRRGHRVHPRRVERDVVEQRRAGLGLVALGVARPAGTARRPTTGPGSASPRRRGPEPWRERRATRCRRRRR